MVAQSDKLELPCPTTLSVNTIYPVILLPYAVH